MMSIERLSMNDLRELVASVPIEQLPDILAELERAKATAFARLQNPANGAGDNSPNGTCAREDHLLTAEEVATILQVNRKWVYRHADDLGVVRLSRRNIRFPGEAVHKYIRKRKVASTRR